MKRYPYTYCSGMMVIFTGDVMATLSRVANFTPMFWIDDIYLFGLLPAIAGNVTFYDVGYRQGISNLDYDKCYKCLKENPDSCPTLGMLTFEPEQALTLWNLTTVRKRNT